MKDIELWQGDCLELMDNIPDKSVDCIITDLPYGITQCKWDIVIPFESLWKQYDRVIKDNGAVVLFGAEPFSSYLRLSNIKNYKYDWIWDKVRGTNYLNAKRQPMRHHEVISVFYKKQCTYNPQKTYGHKKIKSCKREGAHPEVYNKQKNNYIYESTERYPRSIQVFSTDSQKSALSPTQKPVALMEYLIKTYTNETEIVLDSCMGSGTTGVACINTNRKFIGIELEEKYFNIAKERIEKTEEKRCIVLM